MSTVIIVILILLGVVLAVWLSTLRFVTPPTGQLMVEQFFDKNVQIIGIGIPDIKIPENRIDPRFGVTTIKIDNRKSAWLLLIWPSKIAHFDYRHKRFKTLKEVNETGGTLSWEPSIEKDSSGKQVKSKNDPETIVLGEWKEKDKKSLFVREREDIVIKFRSKDGIQAIAKGYVKYLIWDMSAAISTTFQFKSDPEKAIIDQFQDWAKEKKYFDEINGISFENIQTDNAKAFFWALNESIYKTGVIVEDVELTEFIILPESMDVAEAQELAIENSFKLAAEEIESKRKEVEGQGNKKKQELENIAKQDLLKKEAEVIVNKDKSLKQNETEQTDKLRVIKVSEDKGMKENEVYQFKQEQEIMVANKAKLIDKLGEYKGVVDKTEVQKARALGKLTGTLFFHEKSGGSNLDDKLLEAEVIGNALNTKKEVPDDK